ncbi:post-PEP-CTERM-1 domain-containing protein [Roseateles amylovorans]|uniref:Uncharacterized protein n=1 Tax=Roseateles amylovorans TaxID=2978473 RepID=A0ABY6B6C5_9BURK|nr:hypothetical protein [Roseateles amylovorans]UXH80725.1 hypothetical protein N4261_12950 [Roseateles amylovorans]
MQTRTILGLALAAALPLSALAHEGHERQEALPVSAAAAADTTNQIVVVRDAETGKLRAATAEEHAALQSLRNVRRSVLRAAPVTPQIKYHANGATGVRVTDEMTSFSVMVRRADGSLAERCFATKEEAEAAVRNGIVESSALPTK